MNDIFSHVINKKFGLIAFATLLSFIVNFGVADAVDQTNDVFDTPTSVVDQHPLVPKAHLSVFTRISTQSVAELSSNGRIISNPGEGNAIYTKFGVYFDGVYVPDTATILAASIIGQAGPPPGLTSGSYVLVPSLQGSQHAAPFSALSTLSLSHDATMVEILDASSVKTAINGAINSEHWVSGQSLVLLFDKPMMESEFIALKDYFTEAVLSIQYQSERPPSTIKPEITVRASLDSELLDVTVTSEEEHTKIIYTTDGSYPNINNGDQVPAPLLLSPGTPIRSIALDRGVVVGELAEATVSEAMISGWLPTHEIPTEENTDPSEQFASNQLPAVGNHSLFTALQEILPLSNESTELLSDTATQDGENQSSVGSGTVAGYSGAIHDNGGGALSSSTPSLTELESRIAPSTATIGDINTSKPVRFGELDGGLSVGQMGEVGYQVPISLPEAPGGIVPSLSLGYTSTAGSGIAGMGWSVSGLSMMSRCGKSYARDGVKQSVQFNGGDAYCMDGQRLIPINGANGLSGTEYRTESNNYDVIHSHENVPAGTTISPKYWTVSDKTGLTYHFGKGLSSDGQAEDEGRIPANTFTGGDNGRINTWLLNKAEDSLGNQFLVDYFDSTASGFRVRRIRYGDAGTTKIQAFFNYYNAIDEFGSPVNYQYLKDRRFANHHYLKNIEIYRGSVSSANLIGSYHFGYDVQRGHERWQLTELQYCGQTSCLPSKQFDWSERPVIDANAGGYWDSHGFHPYETRTADFNGDGRTDIYGYQDSTNTWRLCLSTGTNNLCNSKTLPHPTENGSSSGAFTGYKSGDFNGDGLTDLLIGQKSGANIQWQQCLAAFTTTSNKLNFNALTFNCTPIAVLENDTKVEDTYIGDFDGNGLADVLQAEHTNSDIRYCYSNPTHVDKFSCDTPVINRESATTLTGFDGGRLLLGDYNGDGATDFVVGRKSGDAATDQWQMCSFSSATIQEFSTAGDIDCANYALLNDRLVTATHVGDFNGDGLTDLVSKDSGPTGQIWMRCLSTGTRVTCSTRDGGPGVAFDQTLTADFNGDGLADLAGRTLAGVWDLALGGAGDFVESTGVVGWPTPLVPQALVGDYNGDGRHEVAGIVTASSSANYLDFNVGFTPQGVESLPVITRISTNGLPGNLSGHFSDTAEITYDYTEQDNVNTDDYPVREVTGPVLVATQIRTPSHLMGQHNDVNYSYGKLRMQARGLGLLGFDQQTAEDLTSLSKSVTEYQITYPFIGRVKKSFSYLKYNSDWNRKLEEYTPTYGYRTQSGQVQVGPEATANSTDSLLTEAPYFIFSVNDTTKSWRYYTGEHYKTVNNAWYDANAGGTGFDDYGNSLFLRTTITDEKKNYMWRTVLRNTYDGTGATGRLASAETTHTSSEPGATQTIVKNSTFTYYPSGQLQTEVVEPGMAAGNTIEKAQYLKTEYAYDSYGNTTSVTLSGYDRNGALQSRQSTMSTSYHSASGLSGNKPTKRVITTNPLAQSATTEYHLNHGNILYHKDINNLVTSTTYDEYGAMPSETRPDGSLSWVSTHDFVSANTAHAPANAYSYIINKATEMPDSITFFDASGNTLRQVKGGFATGSQIYSDSLYDEKGRLTHQYVPYFSSSSPSGHTSHLYFKNSSLKLNTTYPDGTYVDIRYGTNYVRTYNNVAKPNGSGGFVAALNRQFEYSYANGKPYYLLQGQAGNYSRVTKRYDAAGRLIRTYDGDGNNTYFSWDLRDRKTQQNDPDMGIWNYRYTSFGELTRQQDANGNVTYTNYDSLGRPTRKWNGDSDTGYTYDPVNAKGALDFITYKSSAGKHYTQWLEYDTLSRPIETRTCIGLGQSGQCNGIDVKLYKFEFLYDNISRRSIVKYPGGKTLRNYFNNGHLSEVRVNNVMIWKPEEKNALDQMVRVKHGNGLKTHYGYNADYKLTHIDVLNGASPRVQHEYVYHGIDGRLKSRNDLDNDVYEKFGYDELGRLAWQKREHAGIGQSYTYTYDKLGNLTSKPDLAELVGKTIEYGAGSAGPHAVSKIGTRTFNYDANGNLLSDGKRNVTWSQFNKPKQIDSSTGNTSVSFLYGPGDMRIRRIGNTETTTYLDASFGDDAHYEETVASNGGVTKRWYYSIGGKTIAIDKVDPQGSLRLYPHHDRLGSIVALTKDNTAIVERFSYDPWGKRRSLNGDESNSITSTQILHGFTGHEMLDELDLIHMNGRIYDPTIGRFMSADPFVQFPGNTQSFNRYSYVLNSPLSATDPSGYFLKKAMRGFGNFMRTYARPVMAAGFAITATLATKGAGAGFAKMILAGAVGGGVGRSVGSVLAGNGFKDSLKMGLRGAFQGAISAGLANKLGGIGPKLIRVVSHGVSQGVLNKAVGGDFRSGFVSAITGSLTPDIGKQELDVAVASAAGGVSAELSGGKFADGAVTAGFVRLFNHWGKRVDLTEHENINGSHTISDHVGKSETYLRGKLEPATIGPVTRYKEFHSTFSSLESANRLVSSTLSQNMDLINTWLESDTAIGLRVDGVFSTDTGILATNTNIPANIMGGYRPPHISITPVKGVSAYLRKYNGFPQGYYIHTAYPSRLSE